MFLLILIAGRIALMLEILIVTGAVINVESVLGRVAYLPCDIESSVKDHRVYMVLWFKESAGKPIYR